MEKIRDEREARIKEHFDKKIETVVAPIISVKKVPKIIKQKRVDFGFIEEYMGHIKDRQITACNTGIDNLVLGCICKVCLQRARERQ